MLRRGFEPRSWAREARMLGRTTPAEQNLSFKPLQGLQVNPYRVFGVVGAEPHKRTVY